MAAFRLVVVRGLAVLLVLAGCSSVAEPSSAPSAAVSDRSADPVAQALEAYRWMWVAYMAASDSGSGPSPQLARYAGGSALRVLREGLAANHAKGWVTRGARPRPAPSVAGVRPPAAPAVVDVVDCVDDSRWLLYTADGRLVDDRPGGRRRVTATVQRRDATWKVVLFAAGGVGSC